MKFLATVDTQMDVLSFHGFVVSFIRFLISIVL